MAGRWVLQGLVVAALVVATAQAATVTIYNPAGLVVNIQNDDKNVKISTGEVILAVDLTQAQQNFQFSVADGEAVDVTVHDGDVLVVIPDPDDDYSGNAIKAFKVLPAPAAVQYNSIVPKPAVGYESVTASIPQYDTRVFPTPNPPSTP